MSLRAAVRPPRPVTAFIVLAGLMLGAPRAGAQDAASNPALALVRLGDTAEVLAGSRPNGVDPMAPPVFGWRVSSGGASPWGILQPLSPAATGLPVELRKSPWRLETAGLVRGQLLHHRLLPLTGELGLVGGRLEALEGVARVRIASVDDWTIVLVEQDANGLVYLRRIAAEGPAIELEVHEEGTWPTGWPAATELLTVDADAGRVAAFGIEPPATVRVATTPETPVPPLVLERPSLVAGALLKDGPAIASLADATLRLHVLGPSGWELRAQMPWPDTSPAGALLMGAATEDGSVAVIATASAAAADAAPAVTIVTTDARTFGTPTRPEPAHEPAPALGPRTANPPEPIAPESPQGMAPTRLMLFAAGLTALAALAVLIGQLRALRRRKDAAPE